MVRTLNTYAEPGASPDADKLLSFRRYLGGAGELRGGLSGCVVTLFHSIPLHAIKGK
jgi:hypothetical protein